MTQGLLPALGPLLGQFGPLQMALRVVAVTGGAVIGGLASGMLFSLIARIAFKERPPRSMKRFVQFLGAIALGLAAWKMPLGFGGSGDGLGGLGFGGSETGTATNNTGEGEKVQTENKAVRSEKPPTSRSDGNTLRIEMLGGPGLESGRLYLLEGERESKTLAEVRKAIQVRQQQKEPPLKGIEIIIKEHSVARNHAAVSDLEEWAGQNALTVTLVSK